MNGIINVIKPPGMTSFDMVACLRSLTGVKKIGHTGTLDPGATGILTLCFGKATKAIEYLMIQKKEYIAEMIMGYETDTQDSCGNVLSEKTFDNNINKLEKIIKKSIGEIYQTPPMYSAVKVNGKKLYELARRGIDVKREKRRINIYDISLLENQDNKILIKVECSKGTYIRTLIHDIGKVYGCGAHMGFLIRIKNGDFLIKDSYTIEEIKDFYNQGILEKRMLNPKMAFADYSKIILDKKDKKSYINGVFINSEKFNINTMTDELFSVYYEEQFLGIGEIIERGNKIFLKSKKLFKL